MQEVLDHTSCIKNQILLARKKSPHHTRISRFVLCCLWGTLKNGRIFARKICPAPGFLDFLCRLWAKVLVTRKHFGKNYLPGKESSVFLALKIEDSLPEKYVPHQDSLRVYRFLLGGLWGTMKNRRWLARNMPPTCIFRFCRFLLWPRNVETWWKSKTSCQKNSPHQDLNICLCRLQWRIQGGSGGCSPLFGWPLLPPLNGAVAP